MTIFPETQRSLSEALDDIISQCPDSGLSLHRICEILGSAKAIGGPILVLSLPCCVPFLYGVPQIVAIPMLVLAGQMACRQETLWLPDRLGRRVIPKTALERIINRTKTPLRWLEKISHPRISAVTSVRARPVIGMFLLAFCICIMIPLPMTNTVPGIAVALTSFGLMERDALIAGSGIILGTAWVVFLILAWNAIGLLWNIIGFGMASGG